MKIIIDFDSIDAESTQASIIKDWIEELIKDKSSDNLSPLRYADRFEIISRSLKGRTIWQWNG